MNESNSLSPFEQVIEGGFCVGCGGCRFRAPDQIAMETDGQGFLQARIVSRDGIDLEALGRACPMTGAGPDEDAIAGELFPDQPRYEQVGRIASVAAVHVKDDAIRIGGSSGGLLTWLAAELLNRKIVDAVIHVGSAEEAADGALFGYRISRSEAEVRRNAKSRYYPTEFSDVLAAVKASDETFAIMGLPCFIKAIRTAAADDLVLSSRIRHYLGLVCGHLKSRSFAEFLGWQAGIEPNDLGYFDFRDKLPDRSASQYGFRAVSRSDGREATRPMDAVFGGDWGYGVFKYKACDFCDDVTAECADISVGDAWLPAYVADYRGTNIVAFRDPALRAIVDEGVVSGRIALDELGVDDLRRSQAAGLRHRNEGLAHRLEVRRAEGRWSPRKRVEPALIADRKRARIYDLRTALREESAAAFEAARNAGNIEIFFKRVLPIVRTYKRNYLPSFPVRAVRKALSVGSKFLRQGGRGSR